MMYVIKKLCNMRLTNNFPPVTDNRYLLLTPFYQQYVDLIFSEISE